MPIRSSVCTYSPASSSALLSSASSKHSYVLPSSSSLSVGQYKPITGTNFARSSSSRLSSFSPSPASPSSRPPSSAAYSPASSGYSSTSSIGRPSRYASSRYSASLSSSNGSSTSLSSSDSLSFTSQPYTTTTTSRLNLDSPYSATTTHSTSSALGPTHSHLSQYHTYSPRTQTSCRRLSSSGYSSSYSSPPLSDSSAKSRLSAVGSTSPLPAGIPRGLVNLGNTCYMNSVLQALYSVESFRELLFSLSPSISSPGASGGGGGSGSLSSLASASSYESSRRLSSSSELAPGNGARVLTRELADLFRAMQSSASAMSPANFKYAFSRYQSKFSGFGQQDAQEFLRYLINGVHEESNTTRTRARRQRGGHTEAPKTAGQAWSQYRDIVDDSPFVDLIAGQLCSTITCSECDTKSHCWDPFWDLSLPLSCSSGGSSYSSARSRYSSMSLSELLADFQSKETLEGDERPRCSHCKRPTKSTKQISLARLPNLLILHLKKFTNDGYKLTSPEVRVEATLELAGGHQFRLRAAVSHHGHSSLSGHYTSHCEYAQSKWFHFNDDRVSDLGASFRTDKLDDAYVLFYVPSGRLHQSKL